MGGTCAMWMSQCVDETEGKEDAEELAEGDADSGDGSGLYDQK